MSRFWLTYFDPSDRPAGVLILDSWSVTQARFYSAVKGLDQGAQFREGQKFDEASAALIPDSEIGRILSLDEATKLIRMLEREIPKRAAAASVKRRGSVRTRARR